MNTESVETAVRPAGAADEEDVFSLLCLLEGREFDRAGFSTRYRRLLQNPDAGLFAACRGRDVVGFLSLRFQSYLHHERETAEIGELVVDPAFRGCGVGGALFAAARQAAAERGCELLEVDCSILRKGAHRFYLGRGMEKTHYKFTVRP